MATMQWMAMAWYGVLMARLTWVDWRFLMLPMTELVLLFWSGLFLNQWGMFASVMQSVQGAMAGFGLMAGILLGFKAATGQDGLGWGDVLLMSALGGWFGMAAVPTMLLLASTAGLGMMLAWRCFSASVKRQYPFGPALLLAGAVQFFF